MPIGPIAEMHHPSWIPQAFQRGIAFCINECKYSLCNEFSINPTTFPCFQTSLIVGAWTSILQYSGLLWHGRRKQWLDSHCMLLQQRRQKRNWIKNSGECGYDRTSTVGQTTDPANSSDMISPAFWLVNGTKKFKITRSDDPSHTALLHTTSEWLGGQAFGSKMTSCGDFRDGEPVRASNACLGACDV